MHLINTKIMSCYLWETRKSSWSQISLFYRNYRVHVADALLFFILETHSIGIILFGNKWEIINCSVAGKEVWWWYSRHAGDKRTCRHHWLVDWWSLSEGIFRRIVIQEETHTYREREQWCKSQQNNSGGTCTQRVKPRNDFVMEGEAAEELYM